MIINFHPIDNSLNLNPENVAEVYYLEKIYKDLKRHKIKHEENRKWVIQSLKIYLDKEE